MATLLKQSTSRAGGIRGYFSKMGGRLGRIGKALLFPVATLPIAAILLRVGAQIPSNDLTPFAHFIASVITNAGDFVFGNLPIIFAVGVAFGLAKDNRGEAALAGMMGMLLLTLFMKSGAVDLTDQIYGKTHTMDFHAMFGKKYDSVLGSNVLNGIIAGGIVAMIYNKFNGAELPKVLGFFSGRRLIPVLTVLGIAVFGIFYAIVFPWIGYVIFELSNALQHATGNRFANAGIMLVYGFINRLLIPFGLHHIPNTLFWFQLGGHPDALGNTVNGDIFIFLNAVPEGNHAGTFQSGFFPIMMFGLPALAAAFWYTAEDKTQKTRVLAMFGSAALISFLTGITEPIEFAFLFVAPALFFTHAVLTGIFGFIVGLFGIQVGFGFSAGLLDFALSIPKSMQIIHANKSGFDAAIANPAWLFVIGAACAATYFFLGTWLIKKFNIATPGRGAGKLTGDEATSEVAKVEGQLSPKATKIVKGLGGWDNITAFANCITRLRYDIKDMSKVDEKLLKEGGAIGVMKVSKNHIQVIVGQVAENMNNEIVSHKGAKLA